MTIGTQTHYIPPCLWKITTIKDVRVMPDTITILTTTTTTNYELQE